MIAKIVNESLAVKEIAVSEIKETALITDPLEKRSVKSYGN